MYLSQLRRGAIVASLVVAGCLVTPVSASAAPASSPLTAAQTAALAYANRPGGELVQRRTNLDGSVNMGIYDLLSTMTPAQAYAQAKAARMTGLVDPSAAGAMPLDPQQCYHGTSFSAPNGFCPPYRWALTSGLTLPTVYFYDLTGNAWPVDAAVATWNSSSAINSVYTSYGCPAGRHCVIVREINDSASHWCGYTPWQVDSNHYFIGGDVAIFLNDYYFNHGGCSGTHRSTACHELGHALGLDHNVSTTSCLYNTSSPARSDTPNSDDYWVLANINY